MSAKLPGIDLANTQFELAKALWADKTAQPRARTLAGKARAIYGKAGKRHHKRAAEVDAWLAGR